MKTKSKQNLKKLKNTSLKEKGITLIALVITIVVLIILAGVAINLTLSQNGIFNKATQARDDYQQAATNEQVALNEVTQYIEETTGNGGSEAPTISLSNLKAGDYIKYDTGVTNVGENGVVTCRVLYDATSEYGVQIITDKNITNVTLGGSDWATGRDDYNNAIATLNTKSEKYLNRAYAIDARCVGSVPTNQNGTFINKNSENAGPVKLQFSSSVAGANNMKDADTNYETDKTQLENLNIWTTGEYYWLASRSVDSFSSACNFRVRYVDTVGYLDSRSLCEVYSDGNAYGYSDWAGLRPCFSLKSDIKITGGNGTSDEPYIM